MKDSSPSIEEGERKSNRNDDQGVLYYCSASICQNKLLTTILLLIVAIIGLFGKYQLAESSASYLQVQIQRANSQLLQAKAQLDWDRESLKLYEESGPEKVNFMWRPEHSLPHDRTWDFKKFSSTFGCMNNLFCDLVYDEEEGLRAQAAIYANQHPEDCSKARIMIWNQEWPYGFGSSVHVKGQMLTLAMIENRTLVLADDADTKWRWAGQCPDGRMECYFQPFSSCSSTLHLKKNWRNDYPKISDQTRHTEERVVVLDNPLSVHNYARIDSVPPAWAHKDDLWWTSQIVRYITRPNEVSLEIVKRAQLELFPPAGVMPHPMIAIYVRHGNKANEGGAIKPLSDYIKLVQADIDRLKIKNIYIGTDDPEVIKDAVALRDHYNVFFLDEDNAARLPGRVSNTDVLIQKGQALVNLSIADLFLQPQADMHIGTRSSNWCRMIDENRKALGKARVPYFTPEPEGLLRRE